MTDYTHGYSKPSVLVFQQNFTFWTTVKIPTKTLAEVKTSVRLLLNELPATGVVCYHRL